MPLPSPPWRISVLDLSTARGCHCQCQSAPVAWMKRHNVIVGIVAVQETGFGYARILCLGT